MRTLVTKLEKLIRSECDIDNIRFVQIGANDGFRGDPIRRMVKKYNWSGILVEPLPDIYDQLRENYKDQEGLVFENVAIHRKKNKVVMFRFRKDSRTSSFFKNNRTLAKRNKKDISRQVVSASTVDSILQKHGWKNFDLLQIDAEGYDFEVIKTISLEKYKPKIIHYEDISLRGKNLDKKCIKYLKSFGYRNFVRTDRKDMAAILGTKK